MGRGESAEFDGENDLEEQYSGAGYEARDGESDWGCGVSV